LSRPARPTLPSAQRFAPAIAFLVVLAVAVILGIVGYISEGDGAVSPGPAISEESDSATTDFVSGRVEVISATEITLSTEAGTVVLQVDPDAPVEVLAPTSAAQIELGDWVNASVVPHEQTLFVLVGLVVIASDAAVETP
jgi:hypothetical protein